MNGWAWIRTGAVLGFLAVALGAFGAHSLKERLSKTDLAVVYQTAATYQMSHALAIVLIGIIIVASGSPNRGLQVAGWSFLAGICLFSGSLYALAISGITRLGMITPLGGLALLAGWLALAIGAGPPAVKNHRLVLPHGEATAETVLMENRS